MTRSAAAAEQVIQVDGEYAVYAWNPGVVDGGLMEKIADGFGEFALAECRQNLS